MKRFLAALLLCALIVSLAACKTEPGTESSGGESSGTDEVPISAEAQAIDRLLGATPDRAVGQGRGLYAVA